MRPLFILILSSFFFTAFAGDNVNAGSSNHLTRQIENKNSYEPPVDYPLANDYDAHVASSNWIRSSNPQYRISIYSNFVDTNDFVIKAQALNEKEYLIKAYLYCRHIGLKLVFPQHYFW